MSPAHSCVGTTTSCVELWGQRNDKCLGAGPFKYGPIAKSLFLQSETLLGLLQVGAPGVASGRYNLRVRFAALVMGRFFQRSYAYV